MSGQADARLPASAVFSERDYPNQHLTREIIAGCYSVQRSLGFGFKETSYRRALVVELDHRGLHVRQEVPYRLHYRGVDVGCYRADLIVEDQIVCEVKTGLLLDSVALPQTINYLKASKLSLGLICYFGPRLKVKRVVWSRDSFHTTNENTSNAESAD